MEELDKASNYFLAGVLGAERIVLSIKKAKINSFFE